MSGGKSIFKMALLSSSVLVAAMASTAAFAQASAAVGSIAPPRSSAESPPQDASAPASASGESTAPISTGLAEVIVTGTANAGGLTKLDAAYSAVSLSQVQLKQAGITSSADVLKSSPGVYIESSGGPGGGANIEVAGFPSNSLSPFATFELNGMSLFPMAGQSFLDGDVFLRTDDTIKRVELVQGGPAVLYGDGQPGLTANYILKRGTDTPEGDIGLTYGFEGSERVDAFYSGPINSATGLYGSLGGYWTTGDGIRDPQFTADQGGQITGTLSKDWSHGSLMVYGRYEKFDDEFVTDTPILLTGNGTFSAYPGFSPLTGTLSSKADQFLNLPVSPCSGTGCTPGSVGLNQENGRGVELSTVGGELKWDFGPNIHVLDDFNITSGVAHMAALYSSPINPESLQTLVSSKEAADKLTGITGVTAALTSNGTAVPLTQSVVEAEVRSLRLRFNSESNEIHVNWDVFPGNTVTVGNRETFYGINETYYTGADILLQAQNNPSQIQVNLTNGTNTYQLTNSQGFLNGPSGANMFIGSGTNTAFFLSDIWKWNNFLLDAGVRWENQDSPVTAQNSATGSLTGNPLQLWATGRSLVAGTTAYRYDKNAVSWTVGLNYEITPSMSAYFRANEGIHFLAFSDITGFPPGNDGQLETADNYQVGYKFKNSFLYADLSAFYRTFSNVPEQITGVPIPGTTTTGTAIIVYGSETKGLEFQVALSPFHNTRYLDGLTLSASGDYLSGKYNEGSGCVGYLSGTTTQTFCNASLNIIGFDLARQPTFQTRITPAYRVRTSWGTINAWANIEYVGQHYSDMQQDDNLGTYYDVSAGISATVGKHWEVTLAGTNLTNQIGVTEENPRVVFAGAPTVGPQLARSIDGDEVSLQVKYHL